MRTAHGLQARGRQISSLRGLRKKAAHRARADTEPTGARWSESAWDGTDAAADGGLFGWRLALSTPDALGLVRGIGLEVGRKELRVVDTSGRVVHRWRWALVESVRIGRELSSSSSDAPRLLELAAAGRRHHFVCGTSSLVPFLSSLGREAPRVCVEGVPPQAVARVRRERSRVVAFLTAPLGALAAPFTARRERRTDRTPSDGQPPPFRRRLAPLGTSACLLALAAGGVVAGGSLAGSGHDHSGISIQQRMARDAARQSLQLAPATNVPVPAPPSLASSAPLKPHEIFGFAPYWALPDASTFDVRDLTTLAYFSVDVNGDGTIDQSSPGWAGYQSQALADLVTRAHQANDRVVLTATCFDQASLNAVTSNPAAASTLASSLVDMLRAKNLDGVNIDFEGLGSQDQAGLTRLVTTVSQALHAADPHWQLTMDTYASAASDGSGFYDVAGLARSVDAFFVMAYDMNDRSAPSPTAALTGRTYSDEATLTRYTAMVQPSQLILGMPFYGYDWPTAGPAQGDAATGPPAPVPYAQIVAAQHPVYWDPATQTPWTSYQVGSQWHQTWFDDPTSLAMKAQLADQYHVAGLGVWALGMDGNDASMMAALLGNAPPVKDYQPGPGPAHQSTPVLAAPALPAPPAAGPPPAVAPPRPPAVVQNQPPGVAQTQAPGLPASQPPPVTGGGTGTPATPTPTPNPGTGQGGSAPTGTAPPGQGTGTGGTPGPTPPPVPFNYVGTWNGQPVALHRLDPSVLLDPTLLPVNSGQPPGTGQPFGLLTGFQTDDPAYGCLAKEPALPVWPVQNTNGVFVVIAKTPTDCTSGVWGFVTSGVTFQWPQPQPTGAGLGGGAAAGTLAAGTGALGARLRARRRRARSR